MGSRFITEELWACATAPEGRPRANLLIVEAWPDLPDTYADPAAEAEIGLVIAAVTEGRSVRAELNVPAGARPDLIVAEASAEQAQALRANASVIAHTLSAAALTRGSRRLRRARSASWPAAPRWRWTSRA